MTQVFRFFDEIFKTIPEIAIIDIGSNPQENDTMPPSYAQMMSRGHGRLVGFEPGEKQFALLEKQDRPKEKYFPYAIGDGTEQTFYECRMGVMSSLYEPNQELLKNFYLVDEAAQVVRTYPIQTKRLDDIPEITTCDYMHMDVQGAELQCLQSGEKLLKSTLVVQAETLLIQMYKKQPLFSEVELYLRSQGFMLHRLDKVQIRTWRPLCLNGDVLGGWAQWMWGDAIFMRDVTTWHTMSSEELFKMAMILHDAYRAFDIVQLILVNRDQKYKTTDANTYYEWIKRDVSSLAQAPRPFRLP